MTVIPINAQTTLPRQEPDPDCVKTLEAALERARTGETTGVVILEQGPDGAAGYIAGGRIGSYSLIGAVASAQHALLRLEELDE